MTRLRKAHVEALLHDYDRNPVASLTTALRLALDKPSDDWPSLLAAAPLPSTRRTRLLAGEQTALDELAAELNEARGFLES